MFDTFSTKKCSHVVWFQSINMFQCLYFYFVLHSLAIYSVLYFSWSINIARFMETWDGNRADQWNSLGSSFHLKIDFVSYSSIIFSFISRYMFFWGNDVVEGYIYRSSLFHYFIPRFLSLLPSNTRLDLIQSLH